MAEKLVIGAGSTPLAQYIPAETVPLLSYPIIQFGIITISIGEIFTVIGICGMIWGIRSTIKRNKDK